MITYLGPRNENKTMKICFLDLLISFDVVIYRLLRTCIELMQVFLPQDEYFLMPQSYTVGIHGYIMVYSVTSTKRYSNCNCHAREMITQCITIANAYNNNFMLAHSFDVVKVIYDKLLDQIGTNKFVLIFLSVL